MNQLIDWLFQQTTDGATYLQVIIVGLLLCFTAYSIFITLMEIIDIIQDAEDFDC